MMDLDLEDLAKLSGPEYAERFISEVEKNKIPYMINAAVRRSQGEKDNRCGTGWNA